LNGWPTLKGKGGELANLIYPTVAGVIAQAQQGIQRVRGTHTCPTRFSGTLAYRSHDSQPRRPYTATSRPSVEVAPVVVG